MNNRGVPCVSSCDDAGRKTMKTLAFAACVAASFALGGGTALAQGYAPEVPRYYSPDDTVDPYGSVAASPAPYDVEPINAGDTYDEDGYDADYDIYYDTVAAENYDDGYDPNAYQQFQSTLDPYGQWVSDPTYGQVWAPSASVVGSDFVPYGTCGNWVLTEYGWTWESCYDWGWAPFHYGRWVDLVGFGWCWVPGSIWGPGWVSWRSGGGYVGWAPLPPRGVTVGPPRGVRSPWRFVLAHQLGDRRANFLPAHIVPAVFAKTSVVTNLRNANAARFNAGPSPALLRSPFRAVPLQQAAPRALPHPSVIARPGLPVQARPWFHNMPARSIPLRPGDPANRSIVLGARTPVVGQPVVRRPYLPAHPYNGTLTVVRPQAPQAYRPPQYYTPPAYHAYAPPSAYHPYTPPSAYHAYAPPAYHAPAYQAPAYHAPTFHAPAPTFHAPAPSYHAPAATFHAPSPSYHSAPSHFGGGGFRHH
jgi:hypothetical protein